MDSVTPAVRSRIMAAVKSTDTAPELRLKAALRRAGLRYRSQARLPGTPDVVLVGTRIAVFVDGEFWHGRRWFLHRKAPATNRRFWIQKFTANRARDRRVDAALRRRGWRPVRFWEKAVMADADACARRLAEFARMDRAVTR